MIAYPTSLFMTFLNSMGVRGFDLDNLLKVAQTGYFFIWGNGSDEKN